MGLFNREPSKAKLRQYKRIKVGGMKYTIQKINPVLDFPVNKMPQIFTDFQSKRKTDKVVMNEAVLRRNYEDMKSIILAGVVKPDLADTIDDIMSDFTIALSLYIEVLTHSLNCFRGLKGLFFSTKIRRSMYISYQKNLTNSHQNMYSGMVSFQ